MKMKTLIFELLFLSLLISSFAVPDFKDDFGLAPESDINPFWMVIKTWDESPFYQDYNGYGQWIMSLQGEKSKWSCVGLEYGIEQGDFELITTISNADFYEGEGAQLFLMQIWDLKPIEYSEPYWGLWVEMIHNGSFEGFNIFYRNGTPLNVENEEASRLYIHKGSYIKFQFPVSLRMTWEESLKSFSFYYGMEGKYPSNLLATTLDYTKPSSPERRAGLYVQQEIPNIDRTTFYVDSFQISSKPISDKPKVSESVKGTITGAWNFKNGDFKADVGKDIELLGQSTKDKIKFGTTTEFGIGDIERKPVNVLKFDALSNKEAIAVYPESEGNGGGSKINQYSIIMDVMFDKSKTKWWSILQTDPYNAPKNWAEFYYVDGGKSPTDDTRCYGIGTGGAYFNPNSPLQPSKWYRMAIVVDLTGPYIYNYVNGNFIGQQGAKERIGTIDGLLSLSAKHEEKPFLLFTENEFNDPVNSYTGSGYLASLQFRPYKMDASEISALGRPTADGISTSKNVHNFNTLDDEIEHGGKIATTINWNDYQKGMDKLKTSGKLGLLFFSHDEIVASKKVDSYFENTEIKQYSSAFELIKVPAKKERDLSIQYGVYRVPTIVLINSQNKVVKKWIPKSNEVTQPNILGFFRNL